MYFFFFFVLVGYTDENIDINWKKASPVEISHLELAQFRLSQDVTTQEYSETYESRRRSSYLSSIFQLNVRFDFVFSEYRALGFSGRRNIG